MGLVAWTLMGLLTFAPMTPTPMPVLPEGCQYKVIPYDEDGNGGVIFLVVIHCEKMKEKA